MIEEQATVIAVDGDYALLQTQRRSACEACSVRQACGTSVLSKVVGKRSTQVKVDNALNVKIGDEVILGMSEHAMVQGSLLVYALPLVLMLAFAILGEYWAAGWGYNTELAAILSGIVGFLIAVFLTRYTLSKSRFSEQIKPHMLRVVSSVVINRDTILAP